MPGRAYSLCKGPEISLYVAGLGSRKEAHVAEAERTTGGGGRAGTDYVGPVDSL